MATFRSRPQKAQKAQNTRIRSGGLLCSLILSLACLSRDGAPEAAAAQEDKIQKIQITHVIPRPDFVGPLPTVLEWTAAPGIDGYAVLVENEIEIPVFEQDGITGTSTPWPKNLRIEPGTYYWRIAGMKGGRVVADSGRAAFVVREP